PPSALQQKLDRYAAYEANKEKSNKDSREKLATRTWISEGPAQDPQDRPPTLLLESQEVPLFRQFVSEAANSKKVLINVSKGGIGRDTSERIDALREKVKGKPAFNDFDPQFSLIPLIELAVKNKVPGAKQLLNELRSPAFCLHRNEGIDHLIRPLRAPGIQVVKHGIVRSITYDELNGSQSMISLICGLGSEQKSLDTGRLFSHVGGGQRTGFRSGYFAVQAYILDVQKLEQYLVENNMSLVLNGDRPEKFTKRINEFLLDGLGYQLPIKKPESDSYRVYKASRQARYYASKRDEKK
ncbi:hypothetical protein THAOC_04364, partial [Thalassiosira oceanica]